MNRVPRAQGLNRLGASARSGLGLLRAGLDQGGFARRVMMLAGGTALGQGIAILAAPILTRLYSPDDYGLLAVYASILGTVLGIACLRYHQAIPVAEDDETTANLLTLTLIVLAGMTLLFGAGLWLFGRPLVTWAQSADLLGFLWLLPLSFLGAGLFQVANAWAIRANEFGPLARAKLGQGISLVVAQLALGFARVGPVGLLAGDVLGRATGSLSLVRLAWRTYEPVFGAISRARVAQVARRFSRFPLIGIPSSLLASLRGQLPTLLVASYFSAQVVGWFALSQRLLTVTFFLLASSVGDVYLNEAARFAREDPARLLPFFWKTMRRSVLVMAPLLLVLAVVAPLLFGPVFGDQWTEAGNYVRVLAPMALFDFLTRGVGGTLSVLERQDLELASDLTGTVLTIGAIVAGHAIGLGAMPTLIVYAIAGSVSSILSLYLMWYAIRQRIHAV